MSAEVGQSRGREEARLEDDAGVVIGVGPQQGVHDYLCARQTPSAQVRRHQPHRLQRGLHLP